jgi:superfamily II DNA/RNA helicase
VPFNAEDYVHRIGRTGRAGQSGLAMTLVAREDARLVADIEKLIKKKIEIEPFELDDAPPRRDHYRDRTRHDDDEERPARPSSSYRAAAAPARPAVDPFFDKPYEASGGDAEPAWETKVPAQTARGVSPNIKPKKKVAALFGAKKTAEASSA